MFTGIVEGTGTIRTIERRGYMAVFEIEADFDLEDTNVGDSISIDGCCLTVTSRLGKHFWADLSDETLRVSTLGNLKVGSKINVERALKAAGRFGGHIVQGHVDGVGKIKSFQDVGEAKELVIQIPIGLSRYIADKGSIAVDGVSLTVNEIVGNEASIRVIPNTRQMTTFSGKKAGDTVNLEVDIIAKYVEKLHTLEAGGAEKESNITEDFLKKHGF